MARRRPLPDLSNSHDRWLVSYADFLMLLFAFFVVMYSTAAAKGVSFRSLSTSIEQAFGIQGLPAAIDAVIEGGEPLTGELSDPSNHPQDEPREALSASGLGAGQGLASLHADLLFGAASLLPEGAFRLSEDGDYVDIALPASLLFPSGARTLLADSLPLIDLLAATLRERPNEIVVQGHTDDQPIRNGLFPSNWELSASRASAIVRQLESRGVAPARMSAQGYAATRPLDSNASEDGRERNRRVLIRVRSRVIADGTADRSAGRSSGELDGKAPGIQREAL